MRLTREAAIFASVELTGQQVRAEFRPVGSDARHRSVVLFRIELSMTVQPWPGRSPVEWQVRSFIAVDTHMMMKRLMSRDASRRRLVAGAERAGVCARPAQADFSGVWQPRYHEDQPERIPGPELRDYLGLPINDAARQFADSWDPARITLPEEQCRVHVSPYIYRGPTNLRIWEEKHPKTQDLHRASSTTPAPTSRRARSGWTAARIRARTRRTPGWDSRPAATTATC